MDWFEMIIIRCHTEVCLLRRDLRPTWRSMCPTTSRLDLRQRFLNLRFHSFVLCRSRELQPHHRHQSNQILQKNHLVPLHLLKLFLRCVARAPHLRPKNHWRWVAVLFVTSLVSKMMWYIILREVTRPSFNLSLYYIHADLSTPNHLNSAMSLWNIWFKF